MSACGGHVRFEIDRIDRSRFVVVFDLVFLLCLYIRAKSIATMLGIIERAFVEQHVRAVVGGNAILSWGKIHLPSGELG